MSHIQTLTRRSTYMSHIQTLTRRPTYMSHIQTPTTHIKQGISADELNFDYAPRSLQISFEGTSRRLFFNLVHVCF